MKFQPLVKAGDWVKRGQQIGSCGSTGNSSGPHCHYDIMVSRPKSFTQYVYGMTFDQVKRLYVDPVPYIKNGFPMSWTQPKIGYSYLQGVRSNQGIYFHPGIDVNGVNDNGAPIFSPVDGRVVCVLGVSWVKNMFGKIIPISWNSGWGNMVVIEMSPAFDISNVK